MAFKKFICCCLCFIVGLVHHVSAETFPVYKDPLTPYEEFEQAIAANNIGKVRSLLPHLSPDDLGAGLLYSATFNRTEISADICNSGNPIAKEDLDIILGLDSLGDEKLLNCTEKRCARRGWGESWRPYKAPDLISALSARSRNPLTPQVILSYFLQNPKDFESTKLYNLDPILKLFAENKFKDRSDFKPEIFLASILSLKKLSKEGALDEYSHLQRDHPSLFKSFDQSLFIKNLDSIFSAPPFSAFNLRFAAQRWAGHRPQKNKRDPYRETPAYLVPQASFEVSILGRQQLIGYRMLQKSKEPQVLVISVYGGHDQSFPGSPNGKFSDFPDPSVWPISLSLWDSSSATKQGDQLKTEQSIQETHGAYLSAASQFIEHIHQLYPNAKILLDGHSFGGFFALSYAFLQSIFTNPALKLEDVYTPAAAQAFKTLFSHHKIAPISGFLSFAGAIYYMKDLLKDASLLQHLTVPGFYAYNHDDDRVAVKQIRPILLNLPRPYTTLYFNREGAVDYGSDLQIMRSTPYSSVRGHFLSGYGHLTSPAEQHNAVEYQEAVMDFINHVGEERSPIKKALQERRFKMYVDRSPRLILEHVLQKHVSGTTQIGSADLILKEVGKHVSTKQLWRRTKEELLKRKKAETAHSKPA